MSRKPKGRMEDHSVGIGGPTPEDIEVRAREIAIIEGREAGRPNPNDREQAERELRNKHLRMSTDNAEEEPMIVEHGSLRAAESGHKVREHKPEDSQLQAEAETLEGIKEAEHDTMLDNRISRKKEEE